MTQHATGPTRAGGHDAPPPQDLSVKAATDVWQVDRPDDLSALHRPETAAVIWRRQPLAGFQKWLDELAPEYLPSARVILRPADVRTAVTSVCDTSGTPNGPERARLIDDIAALADIFTSLVPTEYLRLRLDIITTDACRKFHIDWVSARLICSYRGPGTQYGVSENGDDPRQVSDVPTGAPVILRGTRWPDALPCNLRHRSPPIEGSDETRLVLVLNPVDGPSGN